MSLGTVHSCDISFVTACCTMLFCSLMKGGFVGFLPGVDSDFALYGRDTENEVGLR